MGGGGHLGDGEWGGTWLGMRATSRHQRAHTPSCHRPHFISTGAELQVTISTHQVITPRAVSRVYRLGAVMRVADEAVLC